MRTFKLAAIAAVAITAAAAGSQVRGDVYGYPYTPTYSSYPVGNSNCPSGQCGTSAAVPSYSYAPSYSYSSYYPGTAIPAVATYPSSSCPNCPNGSCSSCPNGSCGSCRNGSCSSCGPNGCCANGRCGTCPPGACQSGNCSANCPNGQCTPGRNRDYQRFARRFVSVELLAARLFPAGTAVFADKLVERPALLAAATTWARPTGITETATTNWRARSTTNAV